MTSDPSAVVTLKSGEVTTKPNLLPRHLPGKQQKGTMATYRNHQRSHIKLQKWAAGGTQRTMEHALKKQHIYSKKKGKKKKNGFMICNNHPRDLRSKRRTISRSGICSTGGNEDGKKKCT